jgi:thiamine pyrophosphokinase
MSYDAVVLANGEFPKKGGAAWDMLAGAKRVVACDGAADAYVRRFGKSPFAVVGDMDSVKWFPEGSEVVRVADQESNDLEKAVRWCRARGWRRLVVVGASGRREDHLLGNAFRALDLGVEMVTEFGRFVPVRGKASFRVAKGTAVSVFAPDRTTRMTSKGLEWPLDGVEFDSLYRATLNRASASRVSLTSTSPVLVFVAS